MVTIVIPFVHTYKSKLNICTPSTDREFKIHCNVTLAPGFTNVYKWNQNRLHRFGKHSDLIKIQVLVNLH